MFKLLDSQDTVKHAKSKSASIGLKNVYDRIKLIFGDTYSMEISSFEGIGTIVKYKLPVIEEFDREEKVGGEMFKIILADDEPIIIKGLRKMIKWEELNAEIVAEAKNGEELLKKIQEYEPDIVISDVAMPRMTGLDVIKAIRANESNTKVIFLSGFRV